MHTRTGCICLAFIRCTFSNVSWNGLHVRMQSHIDCICLIFLRCAFLKWPACKHAVIFVICQSPKNNHCVSRLCKSRFQVFHKYFPHKLHAFSDISCQSLNVHNIHHVKTLCITRFHVFHNYLPHKSHVFNYTYHLNLQITLKWYKYSKNPPCQSEENIKKVQNEWLELRIR